MWGINEAFALVVLDPSASLKHWHIRYSFLFDEIMFSEGGTRENRSHVTPLDFRSHYEC